MPIRRVTPNTTPQQHHQQQQQHQQYQHLPAPATLKPSPSLPSFTRSASPSSISNIFTRPAKWFQRSNSASRPPLPEPRPSTSSISSNRRKPTISGPTDPRPILNSQDHSQQSQVAATPPFAALNDRATRSVLDLSRPSTDLVSSTASPSDITHPSPSPSSSSASPSTGDLRLISRRAWSRSADNLNANSVPLPNLPPLNTALGYKIEQYRAGSPATPRSASRGYPFPSVSPSTQTPPHQIHQNQQQQQQQQQQHVIVEPHIHHHHLRHAHSHSGSGSHMVVNSSQQLLVPPSPQLSQHQVPGHKRSVDFDRAGSGGNAGKERSASGGGGGRGAFSFYFSPSNSSNNTPTPPTIIEPTPTTSTSNKRASQIVHHSGFINRLGNFSPTSPPNLSSQRAWKPFKVVLKGSKLYFYKVPSDRVGGVRELFPVGLVALVEEEVEEEKVADGINVGVELGVDETRRVRERDDTRRKRAYWGRTTHPDLVLNPNNGRIESGTCEALVHEAVFGTRFSLGVDGVAVEDNEREYKRFASNVMLALPLAVDRARFEAEFVRCASFYLSGADSSSVVKVEEPNSVSKTAAAQSSSSKDSFIQRVKWLAALYLVYHRYGDDGQEGEVPVDSVAWDRFVKEVIPGFGEVDVRRVEEEVRREVFAEEASKSGGVGLEVSPGVGTFSPRPEGKDRTIPLETVMSKSKQDSVSGSSGGTNTRQGLGLGSPPLPATISSLSPTATPTLSPILTPTKHSHKSRLLHALEHEGLTREVFVRLDTDVVARSLLTFQEKVLGGGEGRGGSGGGIVPADVVQVLFAEGGKVVSPLLEYFGSDEHPHWLTQTVILHVLAPSVSPSSTSTSNAHARDNSANTSTDDHHHHRHSTQLEHKSPSQSHVSLSAAAASRTHARTETISKWIRVAEACRVAGVEGAWRAIACALCSKPVARLEKAWKRVDGASVAVVRAWVYPPPPPPPSASTSPSSTGGVMREPGECCTVEDVKRTPWCGAKRQETLKMRAAWRGGGSGNKPGLSSSTTTSTSTAATTTTTVWGVGDFEQARVVFESVYGNLLRCQRGVNGIPSPRSSDDHQVYGNGNVSGNSNINANVNGTGRSENGEGEVGVREDDEEGMCLVRLWKRMAGAGAGIGRAHSIDQYLSMSFAAEPKRKGRFAPHYWVRQMYMPGIQALLPLSFPEPLPSLSMIDRAQIVRSKKISTETVVVTASASSSSAACNASTVVAANGMFGYGYGFGYGNGKGGHGGGGGGARSEFASTYLDFSSALTGVGGGGGGALSGKSEGMILPVFDGELVLYVTSNPNSEQSASASAASSRPVSSVNGEHQQQQQQQQQQDSMTPSRAPSIRVKSAAAGLGRKSSRARRASLPSLSRPASNAATTVVTEQPTEHPFRGVVRSGTLDALVHLLIHGLEGLSVSVADDYGEMVLRDKKTRAIKVDRAEFATVWWSVFRSFVSPYVLFQLIRKDYLSAVPSSSRTSLSAEDLVQSIQSRHEVILTLSEWIATGNGAQDILDDLELYTAIRGFLETPSERDNIHTTLETDEVSNLWKSFQNDRTLLLQSFYSQTMRPHIRQVPVRGASTSNTVHTFGISAPKLEEVTPEELVCNLDALAAAAFRAVFQEDLFVTADLLEVQTADRMAWYSPYEASSVGDDVEIQNLYSLITEVDPTSLVQDPNGDTLYRLLPPSVRSLVRAHTILRKWVIYSIACPQLGLARRQARMELFLRAVEVCRLRSFDVPPHPKASIVETPTMRSFVEGVLTSALVSRESRAYGRAWHNVALARGASCESLASLLSVRRVDSVEIGDRLTVDPAWLLERILEVISLPDVIDSASEPPLSLVNYDKRRRLCNVINNVSAFALRGTRQRREMDRCDFERLNKIEQEVNAQKMDIRVIREDAMRESMSSSSAATPNKRAYRPFQKLVLAQLEKNKRDKYLRERLLKEKRLEQQRLERKEDNLNRAMDIRGHASGAHAKHRSKRSMSALFSLMRPISTAFSSDSYSISSHRRTPAELDFVPTNKPALVLSLVDARVVAFINNERSFTFQLDTEDGGHYLLQASSKTEMNQWLNIISSTVKNHAQRRLTYLGDPSQLQMPDQVRPSPQSEDPNAVFGVDLEALLRRESETGELIPNVVPRVLEVCLSEIEGRGLSESGIYRVAGAQTEVNALKDALGSGKMTIDRYADIHAVCGVVKYWFRVLPETVIPEAFFNPILDAARVPDLDERLAKIREVVHSLPRAHYYVLKRFAEHLDRVVDYEEQNHMTPENLTTVICPNILRAPNNNFGLIMANMAPIGVLFKALIVHIHTIFSEDEPENEEEEEHEDPTSTLSDQEGTGVLGVGRTMSPELHDDSPYQEFSPSPIAFA